MKRPRAAKCERSLALLVTVLCGSAFPLTAEAWTEATVRSVQASVVMDREGSALVALELEVRVDRGWLEGLELSGLDPGLQLDATKPAWAASLDSPPRKFDPEVRAGSDGTLHLSFPGRGGSPRRGTFLVGVIYRASLAADHDTGEGRAGGRLVGHDSEYALIEWSLPAWQSGLDRVVVSLAVPGSALGGPGSAEEHVASRRIAGEANTTFLWERAHLPRTTPWTLSALVPRDALSDRLRARLVSKSMASAKSFPAQRSVAPVAVTAGLLWLWLVLTSYWFRRESRAREAQPHPLLPLPPVVRHLSQLGLIAAGVWRWGDDASHGLILLAAATLLALPGSVRRKTIPPAPGQWRGVTRSDWDWVRRFRGADRVGVALPHDATSALGLVFAVAWAFLLWWLAAGRDPYLVSTAVLFWAPGLTATRWHLPSRAAERLDRLARHAESSEEEWPMALEVHEASGTGRFQEARLVRFEGLVERESRIGERAEFGGVRRVVMTARAPRAGSSTNSVP